MSLELEANRFSSYTLRVCDCR